MKKLKDFYAEPVDVRDGLFPNLRYSLSVLQKANEDNDGKYRNSGRISRSIAAELNVLDEDVYASLVNSTYPRCDFPLIDGHGNFYFPPAYMDYTELRISDFYRKYSATTEDCNEPLLIPYPYVLLNGTMFDYKCKTNIPPHNINCVLDAAIALLKEPSLKTQDLLKYINGPCFLFGGEIVNRDKMLIVYERGYGKIQLRVNEQTLSTKFDDKISEYCKWYRLKYRKNIFNKEYIVSFNYNAYLFDGKTSKHMSLKEILLNYIDYYKTVTNLSADELCKRLENLKLTQEI